MRLLLQLLEELDLEDAQQLLGNESSLAKRILCPNVFGGIGSNVLSLPVYTG